MSATECAIEAAKKQLAANRRRQQELTHFATCGEAMLTRLRAHGFKVTRLVFEVSSDNTLRSLFVYELHRFVVVPWGFAEASPGIGGTAVFHGDVIVEHIDASNYHWLVSARNLPPTLFKSPEEAAYWGLLYLEDKSFTWHYQESDSSETEGGVAII